MAEGTSAPGGNPPDKDSIGYNKEGDITVFKPATFESTDIKSVLITGTNTVTKTIDLSKIEDLNLNVRVETENKDEVSIKLDSQVLYSRTQDGGTFSQDIIIKEDVKSKSGQSTLEFDAVENFDGNVRIEVNSFTGESFNIKVI